MLMPLFFPAMMMFQASFFMVMTFVIATSYVTMERQTYVVHMDRTKISALDSLDDTMKWYEAVINSIIELSAQEDEDKDITRPDLLYVYETAISGFAAKLSIKQLQTLENIDGFLSATPDDMLSLHTTHSSQFLGLKNGKGLWNAPNLASDVIIGVIDSGIWPEHISFHAGISSVPSRWKGICENGTQFSPANCNNKLIGARAFFKGYEAAAGRINEAQDFRSARDSEGHGTHTASTAGGNVVAGASMLGMAKGTAGGMRYTAKIAAYKVCWTLGCASSDILAAIDTAVADGVDVLSISLGGGVSHPYHSDNMAIAAFGAVQKGIFVSCSAGNSGPSESTVSNNAPWMMTVAASYLDRSFPTSVKLGDGQVFKGASLYSGKPTKAYPLVYGETAGGQGAEYCSDGSLSPELVRGKIVICERGMNSRAEKGEQVKMAGGAGMLLLNNEEDGEELLADPHILPATSLGAAAAKVIKNYVTVANKPTASIFFQGTVYGYPAPVMAGFSSRGPSPVGPDVIKPDVTAPGVNILAAWPPTVSPTRLKSDKRSVSFNIISGTSMSCPHVSGLAALLKSIHRDWSPAAIKSALMSTAHIVNNKGAQISDAGSNTFESANPFSYGSGHVDPERASDPGLVYDISTEDYLNYLCSLNYTSSQMALLSRGSYDCLSNGVTQPGDLNYPSFALLFNGDAQNSSVTYKRTVTNVGPPRARYVVKVGEPDGVTVMVHPKVLSFRNSGEKQSYMVSFVLVGRRTTTSTTASFGSLIWVSGKYVVRSPIAVTWQ